MKSLPNKAQQPSVATGVCPRCQGRKSVTTDKGAVICPTCRGSGQATKGYSTK